MEGGFSVWLMDYFVSEVKLLTIATDGGRIFSMNDGL